MAIIYHPRPSGTISHASSNEGIYVDNAASLLTRPSQKAISRSAGCFALGLVCTAAVGAVTTLKTVVDNDPPACAALLAMVKAAGVTTMTDAQLCEFRFARLPASKTKGFALPQWKEMSVADPAAMYVRLRTATIVPHDPAPDSSHPPTVLRAIGQAAEDSNVAFYSTQPQLGRKGSPVTFVHMDAKDCRSFPLYMK